MKNDESIDLHPLLKRQIKALKLDSETTPTAQESWFEFLWKINKTYKEMDQDRYLMERSLLISSKELQERWESLELARAKSMQNAKMSSLGEMAGGIAHEINNPLSVILCKATAMKEHLIANSSVDIKEMILGLTKVEDTVGRISKIIKGLRAFSRNSEKDPMQRILVSSAIEDTLELCNQTFKNESIDFKINFDPTVKIYVLGRLPQLSQVLLNLLNNSRDAVSGLSVKWIRLDVCVKDEICFLSVVDSGSGIPKLIAEKLMQPFFSTKEIGKGTGLGLSISQAIIVEHKGRLYYDPTSDHTRFVIELPVNEGE